MVEREGGSYTVRGSVVAHSSRCYAGVDCAVVAGREEGRCCYGACEGCEGEEREMHSDCIEQRYRFHT
jgi:hypothetical protein